MKRIGASLLFAGCASLLFLSGTPTAPADEIPEKYQDAIRKGLDWLAKAQFKDGHWGSAPNNDNYPVSMTGIGGVALLMEGSTIRDGKYATNIRKAADWLMDHSMKGNNRDGLVGNPEHPAEQQRYMYGHGFGTLFLALCYGDEEDQERRERMKDILTRAVKYIGNAQSTQGGWYYTSAADGHNQDEGSVTITQMQALRACRNAGIAVPKAIVQKGHDYLKNSTTANGGVIYSLRGGGAPVGGEKPALTAAAIACLFSSGDYNDPLVKSWFKYCQRAVPINGVARQGHDEYTHYYYAQVIYSLGDDGWDKLFGASPADQRLTWSGYKKEMFPFVLSSQAADGSWNGTGGYGAGPVFASAVYLTMLQLDRAAVPFYQR